MSLTSVSRNLTPTSGFYEHVGKLYMHAKYPYFIYIINKQQTNGLSEGNRRTVLISRSIWTVDFQESLGYKRKVCLEKGGCLGYRETVKNRCVVQTDDGLVVKGTCCFHKEPTFASQHSHVG